MPPPAARRPSAAKFASCVRACHKYTLHPVDTRLPMRRALTPPLNTTRSGGPAHARCRPFESGTRHARARSAGDCRSRRLSARRASRCVAFCPSLILNRLRACPGHYRRPVAARCRDSARFRRGPFPCSALIGRRSISNNGRSLRRARAQTRPPAIGPETNDKKILCIPTQQTDTPAQPSAARIALHAPAARVRPQAPSSPRASPA
ncbi:hypothetical protein BLA24064_03429 [Burkholderia latens]|uniref:Uncharacterized protein n=1 Tax=Burkholderia latens TaxID=488446 RepID=A0A6P2LMW0_9BURK|nr:hypothetical protein BLA24064_03429 [Burkholderia latens]